MQTVVATIHKLRGLAGTGQVTGTGGVASRFMDAFVEVVGPDRAESLAQTLFGIDLKRSLGVANEFIVTQRMLTLKLTPLLLGEKAKTISDNDRLLVAQAMGFDDASITNRNNTGFGGTLDLGKQSFFKNRKSIDLALAKVEDKIGEVMGEYNSELNGFAEQINRPLGMQDTMKTVKESAIQGDYIASYTFDKKGKMSKNT